jgi:hypothetical protein
MDYQTIIKLYEILMTINLKLEEHIYNFFSIFYIYLEVYCQGCQNKSLWTDPSLLLYHTSFQILLTWIFRINTLFHKLWYFLFYMIEHVILYIKDILHGHYWTTKSYTTTMKLKCFET